MVPYEALYGRPCRSPLCWTEVGESSITGPDLIRDTSEKVSLIRHRFLKAQSRHKSYADVRRRPIEFEVGDHVFLKVMHKRRVVRFGKRGKLSSRFIGPFEILERIGAVAYRVAILLMLGLYWTVWDNYVQVLYLSRAPRTKETLPYFLKWRRVTPTSTCIPRVDG